MYYPNSVSPYIQTAMAQAMQAIATGGPLPPNCYVMSIPMEQFPQFMMPQAPGSTGPMMMYSPYPSYYDQYQPLPLGYAGNNALAPYPNYYSPGYSPYSNYPMLEYGGSKKKGKRGQRAPGIPHPNIYNSSSFDSHMENLSWSRIFDHPHQRRLSKQQQAKAALNYEQNSKQSKKSTSGSSTTSDESIRRVNLPKDPPATTAKGSLPFKYSSEFVPGTGKQIAKKSSQKETKLRSDDEFIVQKNPPSSKKR